MEGSLCALAENLSLLTQRTWGGVLLPIRELKQAMEDALIIL